MNSFDIGKRDPSWRDEAETRNWRNYPELHKIPNLANARRTSEALEQIDRVLLNFADMDFPYYWKIAILCKQGDLLAAESTLKDGLRTAKMKSGICTKFATGSFDAGGHIVDSIHWWVVSAAIQLDAKKLREDDPFLHLAIVADSLAEHTASSRFLRLNDQINVGMLRLYPEKKMRMQEALLRLPSPVIMTVRTVILSLSAEEES